MYVFPYLLPHLIQPPLLAVIATVTQDCQPQALLITATQGCYLLCPLSSCCFQSQLYLPITSPDFTNSFPNIHCSPLPTVGVTSRQGHLKHSSGVLPDAD